MDLWSAQPAPGGRRDGPFSVRMVPLSAATPPALMSRRHGNAGLQAGTARRRRAAGRTLQRHDGSALGEKSTSPASSDIQNRCIWRQRKPGHRAEWGTGRDGNHADGWGLRRRGPAARCASLEAGPVLPVGAPVPVRRQGWWDSRRAENQSASISTAEVCRIRTRNRERRVKPNSPLRGVSDPEPSASRKRSRPRWAIPAAAPDGWRSGRGSRRGWRTGGCRRRPTSREAFYRPCHRAFPRGP